MTDYERHVAERHQLGLPPRPLSAEQTGALCGLLREGSQSTHMLDLLATQVPGGVDEAAQVKAAFLFEVASQATVTSALSTRDACRLLGTMGGGYNVESLVGLLQAPHASADASLALKNLCLVFDHFHTIRQLAERGHHAAAEVLRSWADAEWFTTRPALPDAIELSVFRVTGETTTDDLSPATEVSTRPDVPLHALSMLKNPRPGVEPDHPGVHGPLRQLAMLRDCGRPIAYVGDVVGTGSSRKSAVNSLTWHTGYAIPFVPARRAGGVCLASQFAPIFLATYRDAGGFPVEVDVGSLATGDTITVLPREGQVLHGGRALPQRNFSATLLDEVRAGGRIPLIIGRGLTQRARAALKLKPATVFSLPASSRTSEAGFTLAQKIVGRACGCPEGKGVRPGSYCEPRVSSIGSPDTTGPLTRSELKDLACLGFAADFVLQSFCHTVAYPNEADLRVQRELPGFMAVRGGVVLKPGDGVLHSWLNRLLLPDVVGTGGDSHTRFPIGLSFPAGSGLVAFAAATGVMPLDMPESVRVRFKGARRPGITIRDLVHAIPLFARKAGLLTLEKAAKKNVFSGRILEMEGLEGLSVAEAFELTDASAERSAAAATVQLGLSAVMEQLRAGILLIEELLDAGYEARDSLERRKAAMEAWLRDPSLLRADADAKYAAELEIDLADIQEPIVCCPNDPDDARFLSEVSADVDEVFLGSCMTNASHFVSSAKLLAGAAVSGRLWVAPPTRMDADQLRKQGTTTIFQAAGARQEIPGCSLCMGNQARVRDGATVVSTSTRNFPNRMGKDANVYLASAEVAALSAKLGRLPTPAEYQAAMTPGQSTA